MTIESQCKYWGYCQMPTACKGCGNTRKEVPPVTKPINEMNLEELAAYAVTLDGWERMDGMGFLVRTLAYGRYSGNRTPYRYTKLRSEGTPAMTNGDPIPDLNDNATLGCIEAMCRAKHGDGFFVEYRRFADLYPAIPRPNRYENAFVYRGAKTYVTPLLTSPGPHSQNVIVKVTEWQDTRAHALIAALAKEVQS